MRSPSITQCEYRPQWPQPHRVISDRTDPPWNVNFPLAGDRRLPAGPSRLDPFDFTPEDEDGPIHFPPCNFIMSAMKESIGGLLESAYRKWICLHAELCSDLIEGRDAIYISR